MGLSVQDSTFSIIQEIANSTDLKYTTTIPSFFHLCNDSYLTPSAYQELERLSEDRAMIYMPVIIFLIVVMLFGIFGNLLVLYIYCFGFKRKPANNFIITMALFDFLASSIAIPLDIYDMRYHYTFYNPIACKVFRYSESAFTDASSFILILIAIDRYLKICKPLLPESPLRSKLMCAGSTLFGFIFAIPTAVLFGINRKPLYQRNVCGFDCTISNEFMNTKFIKIHYALLLSTFWVTLFLLVGFYIRIWIAIKNRNKNIIGDQPSVSHSSVKSGISKEPQLKRNGSQSCLDVRDSVISKGENKQFLNKQLSCASGKSLMSRVSSSVTKMTGNVRCTRSTKIFIAVSIAFILSFLPSITVNLLQGFVRSIRTINSKEFKVIMKLLARVHFLNHAINPLIYSFLNINFRRECIKVYKRLISNCVKMSLKNKGCVSSGDGSRKKQTSYSHVKTNGE
ncbi:neuropeptide S receptor-like [Saccostrea echinata]|uniref:neuropeptide S receptor-like n=1 Tax=Saccostrea echinata TaxID=191078 RepID=UPI002A805E9C|nr:neuropeptide S receptor-like [Saccostrea echinata]